MRIYGEAFLFINVWMNFLSLLLAARLGRRRFRWGRALLASAFGAAYALLACMTEGEWLRGEEALTVVCLGMTLIAFGRRGIGTLPLVLAAGWLLGGLSDFAQRKGASPGLILGVSAGTALVVGLCCRGISAKGRAEYVLTICLNGRRITVPALLDTGNLLMDSASGLPVVVLPETLARPLLPPFVRVKDLTTLPAGWRLLRARTAAGEGTLMCFTPDAVEIRHGKKTRRADAAAALSDYQGRCALLPAGLFTDGKEDMKDAGA